MSQLALFDALPEIGTSRARFSIGDRVRTPWGRATVIDVYEEEYFDSPRSYRVKHDWSTSPPEFGHQFGEIELDPIREKTEESS